MSMLMSGVTAYVFPRATATNKVLGPKVKVSLPKSYHSADASKSKFLVFKGVSINTTIKDFKELLDFNKINHAETEKMKS